ncbi:hypothetical protein INT46_008455 [Mucor plumbeus]|uniref:BHLH domain-containing protein n=1 Tax=Mucor plumbeus TaxID=97098 RepID=A0A8H7QHD7_9FUNG|nr:hypothetical protein INT46_008455 [Mucor plumbeus]
MPNNNIASSSSSSSLNMPPPSNKRRKKSVITAPLQPTQVALPPPLIPYPPPHLMPSYYPVYHQHPYFLSVGPQPPISPSLSPTLSSTSSTTATTPTVAVQRILPKSPTSTSAAVTKAVISPSTLAPSYNFYPYPMQISPQLHPTAAVAAANAPPVSPVHFGIRHDSVSSTASNSTADQREQARKVSHSAIERRRRERINDKILQLKDLIPSCSDRENLHKMTILQSAIDYIIYLKKVIEDSPSMVEELPSPQQHQKSKSMLPKEVNQYTNQFSAQPVPPPSSTESNKSMESEEEVEILEEEEDEEDSWSMSTSNINRSKKANTTISAVTPLPSSSLKPMDLIKLNKSANTSISSPPSPTVTSPAPPPKIIINSQEEQEQEQEVASLNHTERNMNLENILC